MARKLNRITARIEMTGAAAIKRDLAELGAAGEVEVEHLDAEEIFRRWNAPASQ